MSSEFHSSSAENSPTPALHELHELLQGMRDAVDLDFSGYSRRSLTRRIDARRQQVGQPDLRAYADLCRRDPAEYAGLAQAILIQNTSFFRDPDVWDGLGSLLLSRPRPARRLLRCWCVGCASGEEAYTLAMVLADALDTDRPAAHFEIDAADISLPALEHARRGWYSPARVAAVPPRLRDRYFTPEGDGWIVRPALRDAVQFRRHDLARDPCPEGLDFIACRNTLMYFEPGLQARVLTGMARALVPGGGLLLGRAEGILPGVRGCALWDRERRLYQAKPRV